MSTEKNINCKQATKETEIPVNVLRIIWDNIQDIIEVATVHMKNQKNNTTSKRNVLEANGMLFDPLGLLALFSIRLKLYMERYW